MWGEQLLQPPVQVLGPCLPLAQVTSCPCAWGCLISSMRMKAYSAAQHRPRPHPCSLGREARTLAWELGVQVTFQYSVLAPSSQVPSPQRPCCPHGACPWVENFGASPSAHTHAPCRSQCRRCPSRLRMSPGTCSAVSVGLQRVGTRCGFCNTPVFRASWSPAPCSSLLNSTELTGPCWLGVGPKPGVSLLRVHTASECEKGGRPCFFPLGVHHWPQVCLHGFTLLGVCAGMPLSHLPACWLPSAPQAQPRREGLRKPGAQVVPREPGLQCCCWGLVEGGVQGTPA